MLRLRYFFLLLLSFNMAKADEPPQAVVLVAVKENTLHPTLKSTGTFKAYGDAVLRAETAGQIKEVLFKEGQAVKANQVLFVLSNQEQTAKVQKAEAAHDLSENILKRKQELNQKGFAPTQEVEKAEAQVKSDKADLALAQEAHNKTFIRAPFDGVLSEKKKSVGAYVAAGDELIRIQDLNPIRLTFHIPEKDFKAIKVGDPVTATTDAHPGESFEGTIEVIEPSINEKTRSITVHAQFKNQKDKNQKEKLLPGLYGRLSISLSGTKSAALFVPEKALVFRQDATYVYKKMGPKAVLTKVTLGSRTADQAEILSGLQKGDEVVLEGLYKIHDGSVITVSSVPKT